MKTGWIVALSTAVLLAVAGTAIGTARAGDAGWWVEEGIGSSFDASQGREADFNQAGPVETGSLPTGGDAAIWVEPEMGSSFDYLPGRAD